MTKKILFGVMAMTVMLGAGCASSPTGQPVAASSRKACVHDECLVCKKNADLACVDVEVDKATPSYLFNGNTYHFCSEECRAKFVKNPEKYVGK